MITALKGHNLLRGHKRSSKWKVTYWLDYNLKDLRPNTLMHVRPFHQLCLWFKTGTNINTMPLPKDLRTPLSQINLSGIHLPWLRFCLWRRGTVYDLFCRLKLWSLYKKTLQNRSPSRSALLVSFVYRQCKGTSSSSLMFLGQINCLYYLWWDYKARTCSVDINQLSHVA